jgi:hypothetical protein
LENGDNKKTHLKKIISSIYTLTILCITMDLIIKILTTIKNRFRLMFRPAKTENERILKRYDFLIIIGIVILFITSGRFIKDIEKSEMFSSKPSVVNINFSGDTNKISSLMVKSIVSNAIPVIIQSDAPFTKGETIGIKYFNTLGIIREKVIGLSGNYYIIRYKDNMHCLHDIECEEDELFRPPINSLFPSSLQN